MDIQDLVMDAEHRRTYAFDRKLHADKKIRDEQMRDLFRITIHNAYKTSEVERLLERAGVDAFRYCPSRSTEAHFYAPSTGNLHIVNSRGVTRLMRDQDLAEVLQEALGREIEVIVDHYKNDSAKASKRFEDFAFEEVTSVFNNMDKEVVRYQDRVTVIMGPHVSNGLDGVSVIYHEKNDFLNYKILEIGNEQVVFFDYIFADQAKNVLSQLYSTLNAYYRDMDVDVFHYGKVGLITPKASIGDTCVPIAAFDEQKLRDGDARTSPIHNALVHHDETARSFVELMGQRIIVGTTVNTTSVLRQTRPMLEQCLEAGGDFLDMEWSVMASLDHGYHSCYPRLGRLHNYFAGVGSDKPREGKTLGNTPHPHAQEKKIAHAFMELIKQRQR